MRPAPGVAVKLLGGTCTAPIDGVTTRFTMRFAANKRAPSLERDTCAAVSPASSITGCTDPSGWRSGAPQARPAGGPAPPGWGTAAPQGRARIQAAAPSETNVVQEPQPVTLRTSPSGST